MCKQCDGQESFADWLARMEATGTRAPKGPAVEWVVNHSGHLLDASKDELDDVAKRMLAAQRGETS